MPEPQRAPIMLDLTGLFGSSGKSSVIFFHELAMTSFYGVIDFMNVEDNFL